MKLLIISESETDFSKILWNCAACEQLAQKEALETNLSTYDAFAVLGGTNEEGTVLDIRLREKLEAECNQGKKIFCEFVNSFRYIYSAAPVTTSHHRLVVANEETGLQTGDLLDDQNNQYMKPYLQVSETVPLLYYHDYVVAHTRTEMSGFEIEKGNIALWRVGNNLMMSAFRLCNFNRAHFAPRKHAEKLILYICKWLTGITPHLPDAVFEHRKEVSVETFDEALDTAVADGISMLSRLLIDGGNGGIMEGLSHNIRPDGTQLLAKAVRTDCIGEACGAFGMFGNLYSNDAARLVSQKLEALVFGPMMIKGGLFDGMLRWTESAWGVCYQDDAARAVLPILYRNEFLGTKDHIEELRRVADFLVSTTAKDGTRLSRTDCVNFTEKNSIDSLSTAETGYPSAHYNAYYHAMLLLLYRQTGVKKYLSVAQKGLETLMSLYPDTKREQSETEEQCRMILPLALLYEITGEYKHKEMLYRVMADLQKREHSSGEYAEWDSGYQAVCSRQSQGECSLLSQNGDPVADLLYSVNWLPIGFAFAYRATGDELFYRRWKSVCTFFIKSQVHCVGNIVDGAWCRAFDLEAKEVYGVPHDVGWGPNAVESGWTVSEILMGLMIMQYIKR